MTVEALIAHWFRAGARPKGAQRIGVEVEMFCFDRATRTPVAYGGPRGLGALLRELATATGWAPRCEDEDIVGLAQESEHGTSSISLEPGCQIEFSGAPLPTLHDVAAQLDAAFGQMKRVARGLGIGLLRMGYAPAGRVEAMPRSPQSRREVMEGFLAPRGRRATETMYCTCSVQVNLDYHDEADFRRKLRVANALQPLATALFAASPFRHGAANGILSNRAECWRFTDDARTGPLPFAFAADFGFADYIAYALERPMVALEGPGETLVAAPAGEHLGAYCAAHAMTPAGALRLWNIHNSFLYPQVRPKPYLELRGADCSPLAAMGVPAFWTGLLYDDTALAEAEAMVAGWRAEECVALARAAPGAALQTRFRGAPLREAARRAVAIARAGLARRACLAADGTDETQYLSDVIDVAESGLTVAERLVSDFPPADELAIAGLYERMAL